MTYEYTAPSLLLLPQSELIKQGAEARVYSLPSLLPTPSIYWPPTTPASSSTSSTPAPTPVILKHRFPKTYRHPTLDASLTKTRLQFEARALARAGRAGVTVPKVLLVDEPAGILGIERVEGWSVREVLGGGAEGEVEIDHAEEVEREVGDDGPAAATGDEVVVESEGLAALTNLGVSQQDLMAHIGTELARLHVAGVIHGDLTTSNMMVRLTPNAAHPYEIVLIDFGLSANGTIAETYAVDLYVLERAFASTHPASEGLYANVLDAYAKGLGEKKWAPIELKLKEVRMRGRKRDMSG
ncbi:serine/threonine-protein kinase bud32 [Apiotrichum porosum]|uniref:non-specific serine/threonine protein kinase n=1 Tax=Apiotrichum porosum TaxID=105984 RepID=A0A427XJA7_9TREE|nr:serine/threonine-protein kinase bud32 [Apiotrichum porosum]RSH78985.1 serine/threonine-protein kinase bud32 [Apiotrichum porosum]